jgi:hypothetical protein
MRQVMPRVITTELGVHNYGQNAAGKASSHHNQVKSSQSQLTFEEVITLTFSD